MKLKDCRDSYYEFSGKASELGRNISLAGLALIWAFRVTRGEESMIPPIMRWAGIFLILALFLDFLQYLFATIIWGSYHRYKEKHNTKEEDYFLAPIWFNYPMLISFSLKMLAVLLGSILLVAVMFNKFWQ